MVSPINFTPFDKRVIDIIVSFKPEYELLRQLSLKYEFYITSNNILMQNESDKYIKVKNINLDQIFEVESFPYGKLVDNTFTWHVDWIRNGVKNRIDEVCDVYNISDEVRNTLYKFISSNYIIFDDNYRDVIPIFLSLISESSQYNLIMFEPEDDSANRNWNVYHIIHVPLSVPENVSMKINTILNELKHL
jgi:hypothetical protein